MTRRKRAREVRETESEERLRLDCGERLTPAERRRRIAAITGAREVSAQLPPLSLTAHLCGDPPPGRSALDKRRAALAEPIGNRLCRGVRFDE